MLVATTCNRLVGVWVASRWGELLSVCVADRDEVGQASSASSTRVAVGWPEMQRSLLLGSGKPAAQANCRFHAPSSAPLQRGAPGQSKRHQQLLNVSGAQQQQQRGGRGAGGAGRGGGAQAKPQILATSCKLCYKKPPSGKQLKLAKVGGPLLLMVVSLSRPGANLLQRQAAPSLAVGFGRPLLRIPSCVSSAVPPPDQFKDNGQDVVVCFDCLEKNPDTLEPVVLRKGQTTPVSQPWCTSVCGSCGGCPGQGGMPADVAAGVSSPWMACCAAKVLPTSE